MPKASTNSEPANNNRFNPYITKGISKTLLTPCRQVGLSRRRRTPNSNDKVSDILKNSSQELAKVSTDTTPLSSKSILNETLAKSSNAEPKKDIKKKSVSKCLITDEENDHNSLEIASLSNQQLLSDFSGNVESESDPLKSETKKKSVTNQNDQKLADFVTKSDKSHDKRKKVEEKRSNKKKESKKDNQEVAQGKNIEESVNKDKLMEKQTILKEVNNEKSEPIKQSISEEQVHNYKEKRSNNSVIKQNNDIQISTTKEITREKLAEKPKTTNGEKNTERQKIIEIDPILDHDYTKPEKKTKLKRSLSMKKSTEKVEEEKSPLPTNSPLKKCSIVLSRIDSDEILEEDIKKLQKQVKEKRQLVDDLIQAEIYKKLHNPDKLNELTAAWKTGCISALNDLLPHLQTHGDIDMATLLNNLRVPEKLIKLTDNGDLT